MWQHLEISSIFLFDKVKIMEIFFDIDRIVLNHWYGVAFCGFAMINSGQNYGLLSSTRFDNSVSFMNLQCLNNFV